MNNISDWNVYLVTDTNLAGDRSLMEICSTAIRGGVSVIQLREKNLDSRSFFEKGLMLRNYLRQFNIPLIINDRIDIAMAIDADGVHLGQSDMPVKAARRILGDEKIIGWSLNHPDHVHSEEAMLADYLAVSPVFFTSTKSDITVPWGLEGIRFARSLTDKPLVAIGGISEYNISDVILAGADSAAVVSAILKADDPQDATRNLTHRVIQSKLSLTKGAK